MRINSIENKQVEVTLNSDELIMISNLIYFYEKHYQEHPTNPDPNETFYNLAAQITTARDLSQYGHLDEFSVKHLARYKALASKENCLKPFLEIMKTVKKGDK